MRRPLAPSTSLTAVSAATTPSSPGLNSATSRLSVDRAGFSPVYSSRAARLPGEIAARRQPTGALNRHRLLRADSIVSHHQYERTSQLLGAPRLASDAGLAGDRGELAFACALRLSPQLWL